MRELGQRGDLCDESMWTESTDGIAPYQNLARFIAVAGSLFCGFVAHSHFEWIVLPDIRDRKGVSTRAHEVSTVPLHITYFMHMHRMSNNPFFMVRAALIAPKMVCSRTSSIPREFFKLASIDVSGAHQVHSVSPRFFEHRDFHFRLSFPRFGCYLRRAATQRVDC